MRGDLWRQGWQIKTDGGWRGGSWAPHQLPRQLPLALPGLGVGLMEVVVVRTVAVLVDEPQVLAAGGRRGL